MKRLGLALLLVASTASSEQKRLTVDCTWRHLPRSDGEEVYSEGEPIDPGFKAFRVRYKRREYTEMFAILGPEASCEAVSDRGSSVMLKCAATAERGFIMLTRMAKSDKGIQLEAVWDDAEEAPTPAKDPPPDKKKERKVIPVPLPPGNVKS